MNPRLLDRLISSEQKDALREDRASLAILLVGGAGLALAGLIALAWMVAHPLPVVGPPASGVVGPVTVNGYPKFLEPVYFFAITVLALATPVACLLAWLGSARRLAPPHLDAAAALRLVALGYAPAYLGLALGLLSWPKAGRILAATLVALAALPVALFLWQRWGARAGPAFGALGRVFFGAEQRLSSSSAVLSGCVFGWFLPMAVPEHLAARAAAFAWIWPLAFLCVWLVGTRFLAARGALALREASLRAALALTPGLLMLGQVACIDYPRRRIALLALTLAALALAQLALLRGRLQALEAGPAEAALRALRLVAVVLVALAWRWPPDFPGVMVLPGDGDHLIAFLNDGLHGKLLYRDFWYPYGPLLYYLDLWSARISGLDRYYYPAFFVTVGLGALLLSLSARRAFLSWPFQVLGSLFLIFAWVPEPVQFRVYAAYFALVLALAAAGSKSAWGLRLGGALLALSYLYSHEAALAALLGGQAGLVWASLGPTPGETLRAYARALGRLLSGLALVLVPVALAMASVGMLGPYLRATFGFVGATDECCGLPMPTLWAEMPAAGLTVLGIKKLLRLTLVSDLVRFFYLPVLIYVVTVLYVVLRAVLGRKRLPQDAILLGLAGFGFVMFRMALGRSDPPHAQFATLPALALGVLLLERVSLRVLRAFQAVSAPRPRTLEIFLLTAAGLLLAWGLRFPGVEHWRGALQKLGSYHRVQHRPRDVYGWQPVASPGGRFLFIEAGAPSVKATLEYLLAHTRADEGVFAFPYSFRYNALLSRPNPLTFGSCLWGAAARPQDRERLVRELAEKAPRYVVYDESEWPDMDGVATADRFPEVADFLFSRYELAQQVGGVSVMRLRDAPAPGWSVIDVRDMRQRGGLLRGWYFVDASGAGRWTAPHATARLVRRAEQRELFVEAQVYVPAGRPARWLSVSLDGQALGRVELSAHQGDARLSFPLPAARLPESSVLVSLDVDVPYPAAPDLRLLGLMVRRIGLE